jgi:hypothetical protein
MAYMDSVRELFVCSHVMGISAEFQSFVLGIAFKPVLYLVSVGGSKNLQYT